MGLSGLPRPRPRSVRPTCRRIRFLDIRLAHYQDNLCVHHDVVCMEKSYAEVLTTCSDFLSAYPSETILLSVSNEDRADTALGIFAPSQVLCRLSSIGGTPHSGENTRSFEDTFRAITWEHLKDAPLAPFYDVEDRYQNPGGDDKFDFGSHTWRKPCAALPRICTLLSLVPFT